MSLFNVVLRAVTPSGPAVKVPSCPIRDWLTLTEAVSKLGVAVGWAQAAPLRIAQLRITRMVALPPHRYIPSPVKLIANFELPTRPNRRKNITLTICSCSIRDPFQDSLGDYVRVEICTHGAFSSRIRSLPRPRLSVRMCRDRKGV